MAKEFNTITVDNNITMNHDDILYSLPNHEIITNSIKYMINTHYTNTIIYINNYNKNTHLS